MTLEQKLIDLRAAEEFSRIHKFAAKCREYWPGARIVIRPDRPPSSDGATIVAQLNCKLQRKADNAYDD